MQSTVSSQPPRQICTHFRLFCLPPPCESRVSGYRWRSEFFTSQFPCDSPPPGFIVSDYILAIHTKKIGQILYIACIHTYIHTYMFVVNFDALAQASDFQIERRQVVSSAGCRIWTRVFGTESPAGWMPADKPTGLSRIKLKTWTQQPVPMISEHSAHSNPAIYVCHTHRQTHTYTATYTVTYTAIEQ